jgi:hypothetical protein
VLAVLEDGIRCFQDNILPQNRKKQMLFEEAQEWLFSDESDEDLLVRFRLRHAGP